MASINNICPNWLGKRSGSRLIHNRRINSVCFGLLFETKLSPKVYHMAVSLDIRFYLDDSSVSRWGCCSMNDCYISHGEFVRGRTNMCVCVCMYLCIRVCARPYVYMCLLISFNTFIQESNRPLLSVRIRSSGSILLATASEIIKFVCRC